MSFARSIFSITSPTGFTKTTWNPNSWEVHVFYELNRKYQIIFCTSRPRFSNDFFISIRHAIPLVSTALTTEENDLTHQYHNMIFVKQLILLWGKNKKEWDIFAIRKEIYTMYKEKDNSKWKMATGNLIRTLSR